MTGVGIASSELLVAVGVASVMGSLHCVGMCGPFALMASGTGTNARGQTVRLFLYHVGRLLTYLTAGAIVGVAGAALSSGGEWIGVQSAAARIAGGVMIVLGGVRLVQWAVAKRSSGAIDVSISDTPQRATRFAGGVFSIKGWGVRISGWIAKTRPTINRLPGPLRAMAAGSLTTLLPCGWLYLFLLVAGGTGHPVAAMMIMFAFWIGTLPALTALVLGAMRAAPQMRGALPIVGAALLLLTGFYTATGRAAADMSGLTSKAQAIDVTTVHGNGASVDGACPACRASGEPGLAKSNADKALQTLEALADEPLPCCRE